MIGKPGRHVPAFILLFLAEKPQYGLELLNGLKERMPYCLFDSAAIYKALNKLEESQCVSYEWDTTEAGPPKKIYTLTEEGRVHLDAFYDDILKRRANLTFFIETYATLSGDAAYE